MSLGISSKFEWAQVDSATNTKVTKGMLVRAAAGPALGQSCDVQDYQFIEQYAQRGDDLYSDSLLLASRKIMGASYKPSEMAAWCNAAHSCVAFDSMFNFKLRVQPAFVQYPQVLMVLVSVATSPYALAVQRSQCMHCRPC